MRAGAVLLSLLLVAGASCHDPVARRQGLLERAAASEAAGDLDGATRMLKSALSADPRDVTVRRALADHWLRRGRGLEARRILEALPADVPRDADYTLALARLSVDGAPVRAAALALPVLERAGELDPESLDRFLQRWIQHGADPAILRPLAASTRRRGLELLIEERRLSQAAHAWRALWVEDSEADDLLDVLAETALGAESWSIVEELEPQLRTRGTAEALLALHALLIRRGAWAEAEALENDFLERHPGHPERYELILARARRESRSGSADEGLRLAREATRLRPDRAEGFVEQAIALQALQQDDEARDALNSALLVEPSNAVALRLASQLNPPKPTRTGHRVSIELR